MDVVLVEPQIPANTGNIARLCAVSGCGLHLVRPLGFFMTDRHLKRSGLDYWQWVSVTIHDSWLDFLQARDDRGQVVFVETGSSVLYTDVGYTARDYLVFGSETKGLDSKLLQGLYGHHVSVPMHQGRSLNLSNTAAIVVFEAWRQLGFYL